MTQITLNAGQQDAADSFMHFMMTDETEMLIEGRPGTGKSTLLSHIIREFRTNIPQMQAVFGANKLNDVVLTATTNKAAEVLSTMTNEPVSTIHSALQVRVRDDYRTGRTILTPVGNADDPVLHNSLIVLDEASMQGAEMYSYQFRRTYNCKFLYLGDSKQLAPVGEFLAKPFTRNIRKSELTVIERFKGVPEIEGLVEKLRTAVDTLVFPKWKYDGHIIKHVDDSGMLNTLRERFVDSATWEDTRVLCYTNNRVNQFNKLIRKMKGLPEHFIAGDVVVSNNAVELSPTVRTYVEERLMINTVDLTVTTLHGVPCYTVNTYRYGNIRVPFNTDVLQKRISRASKEKDWPVYFELKNTIGDFRPMYASTVYKAQGSTLKHAIIDIGDIGTCNIPSQAARMLHVAASRPTTSITTFGLLPEKYGG